MKKEKARVLLYGALFSTIAVSAIVLVGGWFHEIYVNTQEYPTTYLDSLSDYVGSYASGFAIAAIEIGAGYFFLRNYESRRTHHIMSDLRIPLVAAIVGFLVYVVAELLAGFSNGFSNVPLGYVLYYGLGPATIDYSNAIVLGISLFGITLLIKSMSKINPLMLRQRLPKDSGLFASLWSTVITVASALVCCGPLPGAIALGVGIPSLYFTALINYQQLVAALGIPVLFFAILLADRRATKGCSITTASQQNFEKNDGNIQGSPAKLA